MHLPGVLLEFNRLVIAPDFFLLFVGPIVFPEGNLKKACRHNAPWFSSLKVGKTNS